MKWPLATDMLHVLISFAYNDFVHSVKSKA